MSVKEKLDEFRARVNEKAENMAYEKEVREHNEQLQQIENWLKESFQEKDELDVFGGKYVKVTENARIKGFKVYKKEYDGTKLHYKKLRNRKGNDLFSLQELSEYHYDRSNESEDFIFDSIIAAERHSKKVKDSKSAARREVVGEMIKNRMRKISGR